MNNHDCTTGMDFGCRGGRTWTTMDISHVQNSETVLVHQFVRSGMSTGGHRVLV